MPVIPELGRWRQLTRPASLDKSVSYRFPETLSQKNRVERDGVITTSGLYGHVYTCVQTCAQKYANAKNKKRKKTGKEEEESATHW